MKQEKVGIILGAGIVNEQLQQFLGGIPTAIIPLNCQPALFYILDQMRERKIAEVYISLGYKKEEVQRILKAYPADGMAIHAVEVEPAWKPGMALAKLIQAIPEKKDTQTSVWVQLADTLIMNTTSYADQGSYVLTTQNYENSAVWCVAQTNSSGNIEKLFDKQEKLEGNHALIGAYHFSDIKPLKKFRGSPAAEISDLIYHCIHSGNAFKAIDTKDWFDLGHLKEYYEVKLKLGFTSRYFNQLQVDGARGVIRKTSKQPQILKNEISWYQSVPKDLKIYIPEIYDSSLEGEIFLESQFLNIPNLSELWLYGELSKVTWQKIIEKIETLFGLFQQKKISVEREDYRVVYIEKTEKRISQACAESKTMKKLFEAEEIVVNGKKLKGWPSFKGKLQAKTEILFNPQDNCFIHGDMNFSNIFYDPCSGFLKIIDPRGRWGNQISSGDIKYDVAKLRHSVSGLYEYMIHDFFDLKCSLENQPEISVNYFKRDELCRFISEWIDIWIARKWDLSQIKWIEALLFLSMIPLHSNSEKRQVAMFARGISLLND